MIRPAIADDANAICALWNNVIRTTTITFTTVEKTHDEIAAMIQERPVFVAEHIGAVMGFASYGPFRSGPGYRFAAEYTIYLDEHVHGQGVGASLLSAIEASAIGAGIDTLIAGIDGGNAQAQRFHAKHGFQNVALMPSIGEKFGARHDLVLMQKKLQLVH